MVLLLFFLRWHHSNDYARDYGRFGCTMALEYVYCWTFIKILSLYIARECKCIHFENGNEWFEAHCAHSPFSQSFQKCVHRKRAHLHTRIHTPNTRNPIHKSDAKRPKRKWGKLLKINSIWTTAQYPEYSKC